MLYTAVDCIPLHYTPSVQSQVGPLCWDFATHPWFVTGSTSGCKAQRSWPAYPPDCTYVDQLYRSLPTKSRTVGVRHWGMAWLPCSHLPTYHITLCCCHKLFKPYSPLPPECSIGCISWTFKWTWIFKMIVRPGVWMSKCCSRKDYFQVNS